MVFIFITCYIYFVDKALIQNRKVHFNYEIMDKFVAGLELLGHEVKSIREGHGQLDGAYIIIRGREGFLMNMEIPAYQAKNTPIDYDPRRPRKLLLTKKELIELAEVEGKQGLTIVPLAMYNMGRKLKLAIAIGKGKKSFDKRETLKKRQSDRDVQRTLKGE